MHTKVDVYRLNDVCTGYMLYRSPVGAVLHQEQYDVPCIAHSATKVTGILFKGSSCHNIFIVAIFLYCSIILPLLYCTLAKEGPWAVHLTLGQDWGMGRYSRYQYRVWT